MNTARNVARRLHRSTIVVLALSVSLVVVAAALGLRGNPQSRASEHAEDAGTGEDLSYSLASLPAMVASTNAAVVATVDSVSEPRWNSADGQEWTQDDDSPQAQAAPLEYRIASVTIDSVLWVSDTLNVVRGQTVNVYLYGDGSTSGTGVDLPNMTVPFGELDGPVTEGAREVLLLKWDLFGVEGPESTWPHVVRLVNHFQSTLLVNDDGSVTDWDLSTGLDKRRLADVEAELVSDHSSAVTSTSAPTPSTVETSESTEQGPQPVSAETTTQPTTTLPASAETTTSSPLSSTDSPTSTIQSAGTTPENP